MHSIDSHGGASARKRESAGNFAIASWHDGLGLDCWSRHRASQDVFCRHPITSAKAHRRNECRDRIPYRFSDAAQNAFYAWSSDAPQSSCFITCADSLPSSASDLHCSSRWQAALRHNPCLPRRARRTRSKKWGRVMLKQAVMNRRTTVCGVTSRGVRRRRCTVRTSRSQPRLCRVPARLHLPLLQHPLPPQVQTTVDIVETRQLIHHQRHADRLFHRDRHCPRNPLRLQLLQSLPLLDQNLCTVLRLQVLATSSARHTSAQVRSGIRSI